MAFVVGLACQLANAEAIPWFLVENPRSEPALEPWDTGPALRRCEAKPKYFRSLDALLRRFGAQIADGGETLRAVRQQALTCYLQSSVPPRLRVPQPPAAAVMGIWDAVQPLRCAAGVYRARIEVDLPTTEALERQGIRNRPDRAIVRGRIWLTDAGSGSEVLGTTSLAVLERSLFEADFGGVTFGSVNDTAGLWDATERPLRISVSPADPSTATAAFRLVGCQAAVPLRRQTVATPTADLGCADAVYRQAVADQAAAAHRCRYFEARAAQCGLRTALARSGLPIDDPVALVQALEAHVQTAQSSLNAAALQTANGCTQTALRIIGDNLRGAGAQAGGRLIKVLIAAVDAQLESAWNGHPLDQPTAEVSALIAELSAGVRGAPKNADGVAQDLLRCAQAPSTLVFRVAELLGAENVRESALATDQRLRDYFAWVEPISPMVGTAISRSMPPDHEPYGRCMLQPPVGQRPPDADGAPVDVSRLTGSWIAAERLARPAAEPDYGTWLGYRAPRCDAETWIVSVELHLGQAALNFLGRFAPRSMTAASAVAVRVASNVMDPAATRHAGVNVTLAGRLDARAGALEFNEVVYDTGGPEGAARRGEVVRQQFRPWIVQASTGIRMRVTSVGANHFRALIDWDSPCQREILFVRPDVPRSGAALR